MQKYKYQFLFGPVPSRRLGISLGVDLVPHKTCSLNCVYCECGPTTNLTIERKEYVPTLAIIAELDHFLRSKPDLDYITFSGSGEPTLHIGLEEIVEHLKQYFPSYKIALLTNGTLFYQPTVRQAVQKVDLILPSLDAVSEQVFQKLNRPASSLQVARIIEGLAKLRSEFCGEMWLEIFITPGLNDPPEEIRLLRQAIHLIRPNQVQLNTLDRPGTENWVKPASKNDLEQIAVQLDWETRLIANFQKREQIASYQTDIENSIRQTIKRRPCTIDDLSTTLGLHPNELNKYIEALINQEKIETIKMDRGTFFKITNDG